MMRIPIQQPVYVIMESKSVFFVAHVLPVFEYLIHGVGVFHTACCRWFRDPAPVDCGKCPMIYHGF